MKSLFISFSFASYVYMYCISSVSTIVALPFTLCIYKVIYKVIKLEVFEESLRNPLCDGKPRGVAMGYRYVQTSYTGTFPDYTLSVRVKVGLGLGLVRVWVRARLPIA